MCFKVQLWGQRLSISRYTLSGLWPVSLFGLKPLLSLSIIFMTKVIMLLYQDTFHEIQTFFSLKIIKTCLLIQLFVAKFKHTPKEELRVRQIILNSFPFSIDRKSRGKEPTFCENIFFWTWGQLTVSVEDRLILAQEV